MKRSLISVLFAVLATQVPANAGAVPAALDALHVIAGPITNPANAHDYYLIDAGENDFDWRDAEQKAILLGGHLASINDAAENEWVYSTFSNFAGIDRTLAIGLTDTALENHFQWSTGEPVTFTAWGAGEPNNLEVGPEGQDYAFFFQPTTTLRGTWDDAGPIFEANFYLGKPAGVVEVTASAIPLPPALWPGVATLGIAWVARAVTSLRRGIKGYV